MSSLLAALNLVHTLALIEVYRASELQNQSFIEHFILKFVFCDRLGGSSVVLPHALSRKKPSRLMMSLVRLNLRKQTWQNLLKVNVALSDRYMRINHAG